MKAADLLTCVKMIVRDYGSEIDVHGHESLILLDTIPRYYNLRAIGVFVTGTSGGSMQWYQPKLEVVAHKNEVKRRAVERAREKLTYEERQALGLSF